MRQHLLTVRCCAVRMHLCFPIRLSSTSGCDHCTKCTRQLSTAQVSRAVGNIYGGQVHSHSRFQSQLESTALFVRNHDVLLRIAGSSRPLSSSEVYAVSDQLLMAGIQGMSDWVAVSAAWLSIRRR